LIRRRPEVHRIQPVGGLRPVSPIGQAGLLGDKSLDDAWMPSRTPEITGIGRRETHGGGKGDPQSVKNSCIYMRRRMLRTHLKL